ncbi:OLC1v1019308C1 [Oldenlandia corymbosa var. corymbosa]|uniref:OLC1v1019308C1 n=1 Tax=Oldenlandia corymbosa var. corymbosa TaxID=529605 RepID=A0AAV1EDQ2_OLDCO|nr:OLC1v1019308C1 [Oldenlandia corymbosa var. corymbosa]
MVSKVKPAKFYRNRRKRIRIIGHTQEIEDPCLSPNFPDEIIVEILSRLPAKSLGKFNCVSKPWRSLISGQNFIKAHLSIASGRDDLGHHSIIFDVMQRSGPNKLKQCSIFCFCETLVPRNLNRLRGFYLKKRRWYCMTSGFGYDELNDDYKVVCICVPSGHLQPVIEARVYSLKHDRWNRLEDCKVDDGSMDSFHYASGNVHWAARHRSDIFGKILSFDLANETFGEMKLPQVMNSSYSWSIGVLGGCLSALYSSEDCVDVWIMKKYGIEDSWTKIISVPCIDYPEDFYLSWPVCLFGNGDILLIICSVSALYNPQSNTFRQYAHINSLLEVSMYIESLVSPGKQRQLR